MKYLFLILLSLNVQANECEKSQTTEDVLHIVDTSLPKHLKGAKITVTLADGSSSVVPAEKFMVVPRKQKTLAGVNTNTSLTCKIKADSNKNTLMVDLREDVSELKTSTSSSGSSSTAKVEAKKETIPGVTYYRRELFDSALGAGVGLDSNGVVKGSIGIDF